MANTVNVKKLLDGPRKAVFSIYLRNDGASGELVNQVIINPATDITPTIGSAEQKMKLSVSRLWFCLAGFDCLLKFDTAANTTDQPIWVMPAGTAASKINLETFGGILDVSGIDATGKIIISTTGFTTTADQGSFVIEVIKHPHKYVAP